MHSQPEKYSEKLKIYWMRSLTLLSQPQNIKRALRGNYRAWISKQYRSHTQNKTKYDYIKQTVDILSTCKTKKCKYELQCCGCPIYAAVEENKTCSK